MLPFSFEDISGSRAVLLAFLGTVNAGMLAAAVLAWGYALRRARTIDDMLGPAPARGEVPRIIERALAHRWQAVPPVVLGSLPWIIAIAAQPPSDSLLYSFLLNLNFTWSLALLANVSYWLFVAPLLVLKIRTWQTLAIRWNDPARTPGIRTFSEGYAYSALFLALGAVAVTVPGILGAPIFGGFLPYLYGLFVVLSVWVGVITQAAVYSIVRRFRLRLLDEIAGGEQFVLTEAHSSGLLNRVGNDTSNTLAAYGAVAGAPGLPYGTALIVQYVAALVGSVAGLLLQ